MTISSQQSNEFSDLDDIDPVRDLTQLKVRLTGSVADEARAAEKEAIALAEQGNVEAAEMLSAVYADGGAVIVADRIQEFKYTKIAAELGSSWCRFWLAYIQRQSKDYAGALENATMAYKMGEASAAVLLARMMLAGEGQPAKPLDALALLAETVDSGAGSCDATILLVESHLDGKYIPKNPQKAYDILQGQSGHFKIMRIVAKGEYARHLYLKAEAIRMGATAAEGQTYAGVMGEAAEAGDPTARNVINGMKNDEQERAREMEWESISKFDACGGKWGMFIKLGKVVACEAKSNTSVTSYGGNINTITARWTAATFQHPSGEYFEVKFPKGTSLVNGRRYAVVYVGPAKETNGMPVQAYDLEAGKAFVPNGDPFTAYPKNKASGLAWLVNLLLVTAIIGAIVVFNTRSVMAMLVTAGAGYGWFTTRKQWRGGFAAAMKNATAFFDKHRSSML